MNILLNRFTSLITILSLLFSCLAFSQSTQNQQAFKHPGIAHSTEDFAFVKQQISDGKEPWLSSWKKLQASQFASLDWSPLPYAHVERGSYNDPDIGSTDLKRDGLAAYTHALCWVITENIAHARKATDIINAWSAKLETIKNHDARLLVGMEIPHFCIAAEIIKHTSDVWSNEKQAAFATMLRKITYPLIKDFYPSANGNWDASMMQAMISMAVFLDDHSMFNKATNYYLNGKGNGAIGNYFKPSGQCQESGRDQAHTQMGIRFLANTCETAWLQSVDLYGALDNRLLKGFEYTAKFNLGHDVPYEPYVSFDNRYHYKKLSNDARGRLQAMYERVYNHYHHRKGMDAPHTKAARLKNRTNPPRIRIRREPKKTLDHTHYYIDTLMYAKQ